MSSARQKVSPGHTTVLSSKKYLDNYFTSMIQEHKNTQNTISADVCYLIFGSIGLGRHGLAISLYVISRTGRTPPERRASPGSSTSSCRDTTAAIPSKSAFIRVDLTAPSTF